MNQIVLSGTIEKPIEVKQSKKGNSFLVNVIKVARDNNPSIYDLINFMCVGENARMLENSYQGALIEISGVLQINNRKLKDGTWKREECVFANTVQLLDVSVNANLDDAPLPDGVAEDDLPF